MGGDWLRPALAQRHLLLTAGCLSLDLPTTRLAGYGKTFETFGRPLWLFHLQSITPCGCYQLSERKPRHLAGAAGARASARGPLSEAAIEKAAMTRPASTSVK